MVSRNWWVSNGGRTPIGPVSTELVIEGIKAQKVPREALVCEVGGDRWQLLEEFSEFRDAVMNGRSTPSELPTMRPPRRGRSLAKAEGGISPEDRTLVTDPPFRISEPSRAPDENEEQTLVDLQRPVADDPQP